MRTRAVRKTEFVQLAASALRERHTLKRLRRRATMARRAVRKLAGLGPPRNGRIWRAL